MLQGQRNRHMSELGKPLTVPGHYAKVETAVTRSWSLTFFDDLRDRAWVRECRFMEEEEQYPLAQEFLASPWMCDIVIQPGVHDWNDPGEGVFDGGDWIEMLIREGRGDQGIYGECDYERERRVRCGNWGSSKPSELCYDEREIQADECVTMGNWRFEENTNGTVRGLHMLLNASENIMRATVEVQDGPWFFEMCDVRSAQGVCLWCTDEDWVPLNVHCGRQNDGKGPPVRPSASHLHFPPSFLLSRILTDFELFPSWPFLDIPKSMHGESFLFCTMP